MQVCSSTKLVYSYLELTCYIGVAQIMHSWEMLKGTVQMAKNNVDHKFANKTSQWTGVLFA